MKKILKIALVTILCLFVVLLLSICYNPSVSVGYNNSLFSGENKDLPFDGYTAIHLNNARYNIDEEVPITFSYGHLNETKDENLSDYHIRIYIIYNDVDNVNQEKDITNEYISDFYTDEYKCFSIGLLRSQIKFSKSMTQDIDFSSYNSGKIIIELECIKIDNIGRKEKLTVKNEINFILEYDKLKFSK